MSNEALGFRTINHFGKPLLTQELEAGLKNWLDYSLLKIGSWHNVTVETSGVYGGNFSTLHAIDDHSYSGNTVYQSIRKDWIWEGTGITYSSPTGGIHSPLDVQIYANGTGISTGTTNFVHYIDYPNGRVVFNNPQPTNIIFKARYSYRAIQVIMASEASWWFEINYDTKNPADIQWAQNNLSGDYSLSTMNRAQLPCIIVEPGSRTNSKPFELGTLVNKNYQDILLHTISENRYERNNITDIIRLQKDKTITLPDTSLIYSSGLFPLNANGMKVNNPPTYESIVGNKDLLFRHARFDNISVSEVKTEHPKLHYGILRLTTEIIY